MFNFFVNKIAEKSDKDSKIEDKQKNFLKKPKITIANRDENDSSVNESNKQDKTSSTGLNFY